MHCCYPIDLTSLIPQTSCNVSNELTLMVITDRDREADRDNQLAAYKDNPTYPSFLRRC